MQVGSSELYFRPTRRVADTDLAEAGGLWRGVHEGGRLVRYESDIPMSTPGSVTLILQAILPYLIFLPSPIPLRLVIGGGTNVSKSPSVEYTSQVLLPLLSSHLRIPSLEAQVRKRGWCVGRTEPGKVLFDITPLPRGAGLPSFCLPGPGEVTKVTVSIIAADEDDIRQIHRELCKQLAAALPRAKVEFVLEEVSGSPSRCHLLLVAETSSGNRLGADFLVERTSSSKKGKKDNAAHKSESTRRLVTKVVGGLQKEIARGLATDEFLEDQLVVFQAVATGDTVVNRGGDGERAHEASLHTQTARWVAEQVLGIRFNDDGSCTGKGFKVEDASSSSAEPPNLTDGVKSLGV